jgi:hypothetical protein
MVEDVYTTHAMGIVESDVTLPPWVETEVPEVRRMKGDTSAAIPGVVAIGPHFVSMTSTFATTGEVVSVARP